MLCHLAVLGTQPLVAVWICPVQDLVSHLSETVGMTLSECQTVSTPLLETMEKKKKHPCASIYCLMLTWIQELAPFSAQHGALHSRSTQIGDSAAPVSSFASWAKELMKRTWPTLMLQCFTLVYVQQLTDPTSPFTKQMNNQLRFKDLNDDPWTNTLFNTLIR